MNLLVCGVGGQGVLLFSNIVAQMALTAGLDVKKSEVHGMAQRGGSVTSHVRWGKKIYSPLIEEGTADVLVAFELLEAVRYLHFLAPHGWLIYDPLTIDPLPVQLGIVERIEPAELEKRIIDRAQNHLRVPAFETACALGNPRVQNTVILGAVSNLFEFPDELYYQTIKKLVKTKFIEINITAFHRGQKLFSSSR